MSLQTLGDLSIVGSDFSRPKPLALLTYLCIEGQQNRSFLAHFIWGNAKTPRNSLAQAIKQINQYVPESIEVTDSHIKSLLDCDASQLIQAFEANDFAKVISLYQGDFLQNIHIKNASFEFEEWQFKSLEHFATMAQVAFLSEAWLLLEENPLQSRQYAEQAYTLCAKTEASEAILLELFSLLDLTQSSYLQKLSVELEELGIEPQSLGKEHFIQASNLTTPSKEAQQASSNLRTYHNQFFGRETEISEILRLLEQPEHQLLTLKGPGGVGKTRLATEIYQALENKDIFEQLTFINLEAHQSSEQLASIIATALHIQLNTATSTTDQLCNALKNENILIVLDNFEQLLSEASKDTLSILIESCPELTLVITSRESLSIDQEWLVNLKPLTQPSKALEYIEDAFTYDAIQLFIDRAKRKNIYFNLSEENIKAVQGLVTQTGGLPLAIELAASWVAALPPEAILQELKNSLDILSTDSSQKGKHQSIRRSFEHSWNRLSSREQTILSQLSIFEDGFSKTAATYVTAVNYPQLISLINKSLIQTSEEGRYSLHPLLKQYLHTKLAENNTLFETKEKHSEFYIDFLSKTSENFFSENEDKASKALTIDLENVKNAWLHACEFQILDYSLPKRLRRYFASQGRFVEGVTFFKKTYHVLVQDRVFEGLLKTEQAWLSLKLYDIESVFSLVNDIETLLKGKEHLDDYVHFLNLQLFLYLTHNLKKSYKFSQRLLDFIKENNIKDSSVYLANIALLEIKFGNYDKAYKLFNDAQNIANKWDNFMVLSVIFENLSWLEILNKNPDAAMNYIEQSLQYASMANRKDITNIICNRATTLYLQKDFDKAKKSCQEAIDLASKQNALQGLLEAKILMATIEISQGNLSICKKYLIDAIRQASYIHFPLEIIEVLFELVKHLYTFGFKTLARDFLSLILRHAATTIPVKNEAAAFIQQHPDIKLIESSDFKLEDILKKLENGEFQLGENDHQYTAVTNSPD